MQFHLRLAVHLLGQLLPPIAIQLSNPPAKLNLNSAGDWSTYLALVAFKSTFNRARTASVAL